MLSTTSLSDITLLIHQLNINKGSPILRFKVSQKDKVKFTVAKSFGTYEKGFTYYRHPDILITILKELYGS
jgi:hypothetical protein